MSMQGAAIFATYVRLPTQSSTTNIPGEDFCRAQNAKTADEVWTQSAQVEAILKPGKRTFLIRLSFHNYLITQKRRLALLTY